MKRVFCKPKCGCVVEQAIRDFIRSSPDSRRLTVRYYRYLLCRPASAGLREEVEDQKRRLERQFYLQFVSFIDRENRPLRLTQELFVRHADDLLEHRFDQRKYHGRKPR